MNKKILKVVFVSAFALVAGYSVYASQQKVEMSDLAMANVEALAGGESGTVKCCPDPGDECKLSSGDILEGQDEC
ncbi:NVEALA domain-containing protein [Phocaeicola coprocola]|uniref:NVEALA domain-containing protein n=1 Tax=Phocaeicola coprocola TaxID=310298 RepID=UPI002672DBA4|nr:NVEALA domain-containing protein [Phocaeicola coprocola]